MRLTLIVLCVLGVVLFLRADWSSLVLRVTASAFDLEQWRGLVTNGPLACGCESIAGVPPSPEAGIVADDADAAELFSYRPITNAEIQRRRFCISLAMMVPTVQNYIVSGLRAFLTSSWIGRNSVCGTHHQTAEGSSSSNFAFFTREMPFRVLRDWKDEATKDHDNSAAASAAVSFGFKIYDAKQQIQLAPLAFVLDSSDPRRLRFSRASSAAGAVAVKERERHLTVFNVTAAAAGKDKPPGSTILPVFPAVAQLFVNDAKLSAVRVVASSAACFGRRGFPLWNILPDEDLVLELRRL